MFTETPFDDDRATPATVADGLPAADFSLFPSRDGVRCTVPLHRPGDAAFSCVAEPADDTAARHDARSVSGDSWLSTECHCVRCETVRVAAKLSVHSAAPLVVVLLDLDNFGFNQLRASPLPARGGFDALRHVFIWAFFGACFARHHGTFPDTESVSRAVSKSEHTSSSSQKQQQQPAQGERKGRRRQSVWQRLVAQGRCHFTPCGGQPQAVDNVMVRVAFAMTHVPILVLSGDRGLLRAAVGSRRSVGKKSRRDEESTDSPGHLDIIDVHACGRRFAPVWEELEKRVRRIVCSYPKEQEKERGGECGGV